MSTDFLVHFAVRNLQKIIRNRSRNETLVSDFIWSDLFDKTWILKFYFKALDLEKDWKGSDTICLEGGSTRENSVFGFWLYFLNLKISKQDSKSLLL